MKLLTALALFGSIAAAWAADLDLHPLSDEKIALTNQKATTWRAGRNFKIEDWERVKKMASGVLPYKSPQRRLGVIKNPHDESESIPESYDARKAYPKCESLFQLRDQSNCGSCWAVAATAAMSDRICIHSNATRQLYVSAEDLIACCYGLFSCGQGCSGGFISQPWNYWGDDGIVTGGNYNASQGCKDYSMEPCEHHVDHGNRPQCSSLENYDTPKCIEECYNSSLNYKKSLTFGKHTVTLDNAKQIQLEIFKNGPVEAAFTVYEDFPNYKSGVYQATSHRQLGGHAVKILGWGVENDVKYWLVANSWNSDWGDKGFFKILRGEDHCGIESDVAAAVPDFSRF